MPSLLSHHSGARDENHSEIVAPRSPPAVARGRDGDVSEWDLESARACALADAAPPRRSPISPSTERCSADSALSILERRASISCSLADSIGLDVTHL